jgi:cell division protein FtsN
MQTNQPRVRKKKPILWILAVVAVLLIGAMGMYSWYMWTHPPQVRTTVVARGKIPAPPPSPASETRDGPPVAVQSEPPAEGDSSVSGVDARSQGDLESNRAASVDAGAHENAPQVKAEIAVAPEEDVAADSPSAVADDTQQAGSAGSSDGKASVPGSGGDAQPATTAAEELQATAQESPEIKPSSDNAPPPPTARAESTPAPESLNVSETLKSYAIQVGAYRSKSNADRQIGQLQEKGFPAYLYEKIDSDQRAWYFVRFGRFGSYHAAARALTAFKAQEQMDGAIVRSKPN